MIRKLSELETELSNGSTISRLVGLGDRTWRWVVTDTSEAVYLRVVKRAIEKGVLCVIQRDLDGEPMQYGALS